jgi:hypothetical protein
MPSTEKESNRKRLVSALGLSDHQTAEQHDHCSPGTQARRRFMKRAALVGVPLILTLSAQNVMASDGSGSGGSGNMSSPP